MRSGAFRMRIAGCGLRNIDSKANSTLISHNGFIFIYDENRIFFIWIVGLDLTSPELRIPNHVMV